MITLYGYLQFPKIKTYLEKKYSITFTIINQYKLCINNIEISGINNYCGGLLISNLVPKNYSRRTSTSNELNAITEFAELCRYNHIITYFANNNNLISIKEDLLVSQFKLISKHTNARTHNKIEIYEKQINIPEEDYVKIETYLDSYIQEELIKREKELSNV